MGKEFQTDVVRLSYMLSVSCSDEQGGCRHAINDAFDKWKSAMISFENYRYSNGSEFQSIEEKVKLSQQ